MFAVYETIARAIETDDTVCRCHLVGYARGQSRSSCRGRLLDKLDSCPSGTTGSGSQCLPGIHFFRLHAFVAFDAFVRRYMHPGFCWDSCATLLANFLDSWCHRHDKRAAAAFQGWNSCWWKKVL
jgi:hypothetical protein